MNKNRIIYNVFEREDNLSYYLLGAYMADGSISYDIGGGSPHVRLDSNDLDWLNLIRDIAFPDNIISNMFI